MRLPVNQLLPLAALVMIAGCGGGGGMPVAGPALPVGNSPAADYPVVVGDPFTIEGTAYAPVDRMNYDAVGYASAGGEGGASVSIAHKTLPLPSYAEVTALDSGKTALVRVERRGPMTNDRLVEFSPGAAAQLGLTGALKAPIRIRRVNPPEMERAMLRSGQRATDRMDTPPSLLVVLKRRLEPQTALSAPMPAVTPTPAPIASATPSPRSAPMPKPSPRPRVTPAPSPAASAAPAPAAGGSLVVQVATFGNPRNASAAAAKVGGSQRASGKLSRVYMGPFANRAAAEAALAKARAAGYSDARIQRAD